METEQVTNVSTVAQLGQGCNRMKGQMAHMPNHWAILPPPEARTVAPFLGLELIN